MVCGGYLQRVAEDEEVAEHGAERHQQTQEPGGAQQR